MSRAVLLVVTLVVLLASASIVAWSFFGLGNTQTPSTTLPSKAPQTERVTPIQQAGCVPPVVNSSTLAFFDKNTNVYGLRGRVKEIRETSKAKELITDIKGQNVPKFFVNEHTEYFFSSGGKDTIATANDLKVDQKVVLSIHCSATKTWFTSKVRIVTSGATSTQPATSSSAQ